MPEKTERCVESVLEDNPDYSEPRAWAICKSQEAAGVDEPAEVAALAETELMAEALDALAEERPNEWGRYESEHGVAWVGLSTGATVYQEREQEQEQDEDAFAVDVYEVRQEGEEGPAEPGALLGLAVDMPEGAVYCDWNQEQWPEDEQLSGPHVSEYASVEDLAQATSNEVDLVETVGADADPGEAETQGGLAQQATTIDAVTLAYPPGGEVIDHDEGDWEAFLDDLAALGDPFQVWKGIQRHPEDDLESHDHATHLALDADKDAGDVEAVLADHPAVEYTINAESVSEFDQPEDWDPEGSDFYHSVDSVVTEGEVVTFTGLSQEATTAIRERYNVSVVE